MTGDGPRREGAIVTGEVIRVPEDFYRFGTGVLTLYVTEIVSRGPFEGAEWVELRGRELTPGGALRPRERYAFVRVDRVTVVTVPAR